MIILGGNIPSVLAREITRAAIQGFWAYYKKYGQNDILSMRRRNPESPIPETIQAAQKELGYPWLEIRSFLTKKVLDTFLPKKLNEDSLFTNFTKLKIRSLYSEAQRTPTHLIREDLKMRQKEKETKSPEMESFRDVPGKKSNRYGKDFDPGKGRGKTMGVMTRDVKPQTKVIATTEKGSFDGCLSEVGFFNVTTFNDNPDEGKFHYVSSITDIAMTGYETTPNFITSYLDGRYYEMLTQLFARARMTVTMPSEIDIRAHFTAVFSLMRVLSWMKACVYLREQYDWKNRCSSQECARIIPDSVVDLTKYLALTSARWPMIYEPYEFTLQKCVLPPFWQAFAHFSVQPFTMGRIDNIIYHFRPAGLVATTDAALQTYLASITASINATMHVSTALAALLPWRICLQQPGVLDDPLFHTNIWMNNSVDFNPSVATVDTITNVSSTSCEIDKLTSLFMPLYATDLGDWVNFASGVAGDVTHSNYWNPTSHSWTSIPVTDCISLRARHADPSVSQNYIYDTLNIQVSARRIREYLVELLPTLFGEGILQQVLRGSDASLLRPSTLDTDAVRKVC